MTILFDTVQGHRHGSIKRFTPQNWVPNHPSYTTVAITLHQMLKFCNLPCWPTFYTPNTWHCCGTKKWWWRWWLCFWFLVHIRDSVGFYGFFTFYRIVIIHCVVSKLYFSKIFVVFVLIRPTSATLRVLLRQTLYCQFLPLLDMFDSRAVNYLLTYLLAILCECRGSERADMQRKTIVAFLARFGRARRRCETTGESGTAAGIGERHQQARREAAHVALAGCTDASTPSTRPPQMPSHVHRNAPRPVARL